MPIAITLAGEAFGQQTPDPPSHRSRPAAETTAPQTKPAPSQGTRKNPPEGHERILGVIPAFDVTNLRGAPHLTPEQKFKLFTRQAFDPFQWAAAGGRAGLSQAQNGLPGYGQGAAGYGKRYGAAIADVTDHAFMSNFLFPVLLKQDPRYFRLGQGAIKHRFLYSLEQEFVCRSDGGARQFNLFKVLGAFAARGLSNAYYASGDRGFGITVRRSGMSILYGMGSGLAAEFWPDVNCKVFHRCRKS